jgi:hypothetical protein
VQYPGYTTAITVATGALVGLASSAAALALLNGGKLPGGLVLPGAGGAAGGAKALGGLALSGAAVAGTAYAGHKGLGWIESKLWQWMSPDGKDPREGIAPSAAPARSIGDRLGGATGPLPLLQQDLKGEILVRVTGAPGLNVEAETRTSNPRIPFRAQVGQSMVGAGY